MNVLKISEMFLEYSRTQMLTNTVRNSNSSTWMFIETFYGYYYASQSKRFEVSLEL